MKIIIYTEKIRIDVNDRLSDEFRERSTVESQMASRELGHQRLNRDVGPSLDGTVSLAEEDLHAGQSTII